ncbi:MAG TPA: ATP-binding protein [Abditibacterium sp.]|jgi:signal transduction histidine kinase
MAHKILVVDDEPDLEILVRQRFRRAIRSGDYEFFFAHNGVEAINKLNENWDIAVVLTDINMPQMDGLTLVGEMERLNEQAGHMAKAVVVSAYGDMDNIRTAMNRGAFDFLTKPIDFQDVEITIGKTLDYVRQLKESKRVEEYRIAKNVAEDNYSRLKELETLRDSLVHMIVHDLRTPLTAIIGGMETVSFLGELNEMQRESLTIASNGAQTLLDMINDLLTISKMESGALSIAAREVHAGEIIPRVLTQVAGLGCQKSVALHHEVAGGLPAFLADEEMVCRVLVNLMANAIKFTPSGGVVRLHAQLDPQGDGLLFAVNDTGCGIAPEAFEHIFDKFGQVEGSGGTRTSTGLGLTFCKMAIEAHGGRIWVESTEGQGSTFSFVLPCG